MVDVQASIGVGAQVRGGEKSTHIVFTKRLSVKDRETDEEKKIGMLKAFSVFNVAQIDGLQPSEDIEQTEPETREDGVTAFIAATKADIRIGGDQACYVPALDFICLPPEAASESVPMPGKQEGKPIPHGLQPGKAREKAGLYNPANRNKAGRPPGSVNRYTGALKELFLQAADEVGDRTEIGPNGELDGNGGALARLIHDCGCDYWNICGRLSGPQKTGRDKVVVAAAREQAHAGPYRHEQPSRSI